MSTRSLFTFQAFAPFPKPSKIALYKHHDGYTGFCVPLIVKAFEQAGRCSFTGRVSITALMGSLIALNPSFEISNDNHGDLEYRYEFSETASGKIFVTALKREFVGDDVHWRDVFGACQLQTFLDMAFANQSDFVAWDRFFPAETDEPAEQIAA